MIKLAVFDWNGTLLSDIALTLRATNREFAVVGLPPFDLGRLRQNFEIPLKNYYGNMGIEPELLAANAMAMHAAFHDYYERAIATTRTRPGARQALENLRSVGVGRIILSNHHVRGIKQQLERLKLSQYFEAILANDDIQGALHMGKQAHLETYLMTSHIKPQEAFIIGDTAEEIVIGRELGLKTVAISGGMYSVARLKAAKPDVLISSLHDLIDVLEDL